MRILFKGTVHPTALSKSLKKSLSAHGHEVGIRRCEEHVAGMTGYANWHELRAVSGPDQTPSPRDGDISLSLAAERRVQYVSHLAPSYGLRVASAVVDEVRPTGSRLRQTPVASAMVAQAVPRGRSARLAITDDELFEMVVGYQRRDYAIKRSEVVSRLNRDAAGRTYDTKTLAVILGRSVVDNLARAGVLATGAGVTVQKLPPGVDAKLEEYVRTPGLTEEEFMAGLDMQDDRRRGLRDLEHDLEAAEEAVSDSEDSGDAEALARASERYNRIGEMVSRAEWADDLEDSEA